MCQLGSQVIFIVSRYEKSLQRRLEEPILANRFSSSVNDMYVTPFEMGSWARGLVGSWDRGRSKIEQKIRAYTKMG